MNEGRWDHTSPAQERVNWVMDEVMSARKSQSDRMVDMAGQIGIDCPTIELADVVPVLKQHGLI